MSTVAITNPTIVDGEGEGEEVVVDTEESMMIVTETGTETGGALAVPAIETEMAMDLDVEVGSNMKRVAIVEEEVMPPPLEITGIIVEAEAEAMVHLAMVRSRHHRHHQ